MTTTVTTTDGAIVAAAGGEGGGGNVDVDASASNNNIDDINRNTNNSNSNNNSNNTNNTTTTSSFSLLHWFPTLDWVASTVVGFFVVTYWRCTWVLMDIWDCNQPSDATLVEGTSFCWFIPSYDDPQLYSVRLKSARVSYAVGMSCLVVGVFSMWYGTWVPYQRIVEKKEATASGASGGMSRSAGSAGGMSGGSSGSGDRDKIVITPTRACGRFLTVYCLGFAAVNIWRAVWYWADYWILPDMPLQSYWLTSLVGSSGAFLMWGGNSLLAPPAIFLVDGPSLQSPPIAVTLLSSHYALVLPSDQKPPPLSLPMKIADVVLSFIVLPFAVVWFWRGTWLLLDYYLWGLTFSDEDVNYSILYSLILAYGLYAVTCEPVIGLIDEHFGDPTKTKTGPGCSIFYELLGRFRTYLLAWATVGFWRGVWLIWDQFLGGTTSLSAGIGHVVAIVVLTTMGCVSSVCAPPSTMGVDSVPNPDAADEPLFSMLPIPYETLYLFGIGRQPQPSQVPVPVPGTDSDDIGYEMSERATSISSQKETTTVPRESKVRPSRIEEEIEMIASVGEQQPVKLEVVAAPDDDGEDIVPELPTAQSRTRLETDTSAIDVTSGSGGRGGSSGRGLGSLPSTSGGWSSTRRGWQTDGTFRSYGELQREGVQSLRSEYAQRQHPSNKRLRSKFFRSR